MITAAHCVVDYNEMGHKRLLRDEIIAGTIRKHDKTGILRRIDSPASIIIHPGFIVKPKKWMCIEGDDNTCMQKRLLINIAYGM